jgi:flagellar basal-body rod modification protein FlgD
MTTLPVGISTVATTAAATSRSQSELGASDFLKLMTEQLKQQDPFAPTDNAQMVAQMAQMTSSSGIAEMNVSLKSIATQISDQTTLLQSLTRSLTTSQTPAAS